MGVFSFVNYSTTYSAKSEHIDIYKKDQACFSSLFNRLSCGFQSVHYEILLNKDKKQVSGNYKNNYCFLNKQELHNHIKLLKQVMDVNFKIKEFDDHFLVIADVNGYSTVHKYFVTWVRYAYEYPYNALCLDVNALRQVPEFRFLSKVNIFSLLSHCGFEFRGCHSIVSSEGSFEFRSNAYIKNNLSKFEKVSYILKSFGRDIPKSNIDLSEVNTLDRNAIESSFKNRVESYKSILSNYESIRGRWR